MVIRAGISGSRPGWELLLEQEGVPFAALAGDYSPDSWSVVVAGAGSGGRAEEEGLRAYVSGGGSLLCSAAILERIFAIRSRRKFIRYLLPAPDPVYAGCGLVDIFAECAVPEGAAVLPDNDGQPTVFVGSIGKGTVVGLPFDPSILMSDFRTGTKSFFAGGRSRRFPYERVSLVSRAGIRRVVCASLGLLHHRRSLPFVRLWRFPSSEPSVFGFRVDTDGGTWGREEALHRLASEYGVPLTWFIDVLTQEGHLDRLRELPGHVFGLHCYRHERFSGFADTRDDIGRGSEVLRNHRLDVEGFAAPYGSWNEGIARAIDGHGFEYSSEFSYDYDNLPSLPVIGSVRLKAMQVPVHPISIGNLRRQGLRGSEMKTYFLNLVRERVHLREPIFLYHHPNDENLEVVDAVFAEIAERGIRAISLGEFERWWRRRVMCMPQIHVEGGELRTGDAPGTPEELTLHLTMPDGSEAFAPLGAPVTLRDLRWAPGPEPLPAPSGLALTRKFNPWIAINRVEDTLMRWLR